MTESSLSLALAAFAVLVAVGIAVAFIVGRKRSGSDVTTEAPDLGRHLGDIEAAISGREGALGAQVAQLDTKLALLQQSVTGREAALDEQVRAIGAQMQGITALFTNDRARGGWAEIGMKRVFEQGGLVEGRDYTCQVSHGSVKPDALVHLPGGRKIVIDAKFPAARYLEALAEPDPERRRRLLTEQGKELERLGKELTARGYAELAAGGYVVLYLPSQAVYEAAAEAHADLVDRLMANRVVIAGPTSLYALLLTVGSLLTEFKALQQADAILEEARELHRRLARFAGHLKGVGTALAGAVRAFNEAVGSWETRLTPHVARVAELTGREQIDLSVVDETVREVPRSREDAMAN
jgi:DNA recombination protein RmuC